MMLVSVLAVLGAISIVLAIVPVQVYHLPNSEYSKMVRSVPKKVAVELGCFQVYTSDSTLVLRPALKYEIYDREAFYHENKNEVDKRFLHKMEKYKGVVCHNEEEGFVFKKFTHDIGDFLEYRSKTIDPFLYQVYIDGSTREIAENCIYISLGEASRRVLIEYSSDSLMNKDLPDEISTRVMTFLNVDLKRKGMRILALELPTSKL